MEMKVWLDGYQRVVCGVTEQTTCQDIMIALAHASGKTGRFTMIEKWRTNERCLSPTDFPLLVLQKWGEYSNDVQLILCHSRVSSGRKHRNHPSSGHPQPESNPPEHVPVKKSLTFSGAHRRTSSTEQPAASNGRIEGCTLNICHSVESSEQGSVASQSSASLSPYMSLERQTQKTEINLSNGDFEKDFRMRHLWSPDHLKQSSDDRTAFGKLPTERNSSKAAIPSQSPVPVVSRSQPPVPSVRSSKASAGNAEVGSQIPKPAQRKEALEMELKQQNGSNVLESERFHSNTAVSWNPQIVSNPPSNPPLCSNAPNTLNAISSSKTPVSSRASISSNVSSDISSNVFSKAPTARDKNDNLVPDSGPKVYPLKMTTVMQSAKFYEHQNGPSKEKATQPKDISVNEPGLGRERPVAAKRLRPLAGNSEEVMPLRTDSPSSNVTHSVEAAVTSRPTVKQAPVPTVAPSVETSVTSRLAGKHSSNSTVPSSVETSVTSRLAGKHSSNSTVPSSVETSVTSRLAGKHSSNSAVAPSVETSVTSRSAVTQQGCGLEDPEQLKEAKERKELIELIGRQEREMLICESRLKDLNSEISVLEGDLEVDEKQLASQMHKIEEMEAVERKLEEELVELELVSWEDKLILEQQKESRIRTEIVLVKSSISKSETEILSCVKKIQSLTIKTDKATQELNRCLEGKKEKENKEIEDLESSLSRAAKESEASKSALQSLEEEVSAADRSLSKKKEELAELEGQLKKLNLEFFLQEPREVSSTRRSRTPTVLERLGLSRPGSSHRFQRYHLSPSPLRLNRTIDDTDRPALGRERKRTSIELLLS